MSRGSGRDSLDIAIVGPTYPIRGGISHFTTVLADQLARKNNVEVFSLAKFYNTKVYKGKQKKDSSSKLIKCQYAEVNEVLGLNPLSWIKGGLRLRKFDRVILNWWVFKVFPVFFVLLLLSGKKPRNFFICHEVIPFERAPFDTFFIKRLLSMADFCIVHSRQDVSRLGTLKVKAKPVLLFHPPYSIFANGKILPSSKAKKNLGVKGKVLLFFGFVRPYKGLMDLIEAMPYVLKEVDASLLVVGEFWEPSRPYLEKINSLGIKEKVKVFAGYVKNEEIPLYFSAADVVVAPYCSASQSGVIQMAFAFDKPVIATNVGGLAEAVADGKTGYIVEPSSPKELANAIVRFYTEGKAKCFEENIKSNKKKLSWTEYARVFEN